MWRDACDYDGKCLFLVHVVGVEFRVFIEPQQLQVSAVHVEAVCVGHDVDVLEIADLFVRLGHDVVDVGWRQVDEPHRDRCRQDEKEQNQEVFAAHGVDAYICHSVYINSAPEGSLI